MPTGSCDGGQPGRGQVQPGRELVPAEDPQAEEHRSDEAREQRLIASRAPGTSPTKREYADQFMPNWNSCTMPVTTPTAKLIRNRPVV
jgi:hypothetical protein